MENVGLGRIYTEGQNIIEQGETGNCMYVIQEGQVEVIVQHSEGVRAIAVLGQGDFFGEMAIFDREVRMATVRPLGKARVLTVDKQNLMRRIHEDPALVYRMLLEMSQRIRNLNAEVSRLDQEIKRYGMVDDGGKNV